MSINPLHSIAQFTLAALTGDPLPTPGKLHVNSSALSHCLHRRSTESKKKNCTFSKGQYTFTHVFSQAPKKISVPVFKDKDTKFDHVAVYTHWVAKKALWQVWITSPGIPVWKDVSKEYNEVLKVPNPVQPEYTLSRFLGGGQERPNFIRESGFEAFRQNYLEKYAEGSAKSAEDAPKKSKSK